LGYTIFDHWTCVLYRLHASRFSKEKNSCTVLHLKRKRKKNINDQKWINFYRLYTRQKVESKMHWRQDFFLFSSSRLNSRSRHRRSW
jgi:hypothetical protein